MDMKYFRNPTTGEVSAFEWPKEVSWVASGLIEMTPGEVFDHINPPVVPPSREEIERRRLIAYADPITGSDRHFAEARVELDAGNADKSERSLAAGRARRAEIQQLHPWNEE